MITTKNSSLSATGRFVGILVVCAVIYRLIPHPPNLNPIGALALLCGAVVIDRRLAIALPLLAMVLSDTVLGFHRTTAFVYGAFVLIALLGTLIRDRRRNPIAIVGGSLTASVIFFVITNLGVWLASGMYTLTPGELVRCFASAIPFFGSTVGGDLLFSCVLFGAYALVESRVASATPTAIES